MPVGFTIFFLLLFGLFAMASGALAGVLASFLLRLPIRGIWKDALLGLLGFAVFFVMQLNSRLGPWLMGILTDPTWVGLVVAALCAIVRQVLRFRSLRSNRTTNSLV